MRKVLTGTLLACLAVLGAPVLQAAETRGQPGSSSAADAQPLAWLRAADYPALEDHYSRLQRDFEAGRISDQALYDGFHELYTESLDSAVYFDGWVQAFPASYAALLARGVYYYRMASSVRGDKYFRDTPPAQLDAMSNWLARSRADLSASFKLTTKPYLSAHYLLDVAMLAGSARERRHWYEQALALAPANTTVRYRYMFSLRPRWGGSYGQMEEFLRQCEAEHLPPAF